MKVQRAWTISAIILAGTTANVTLAAPATPSGVTVSVAVGTMQTANKDKTTDTTTDTTTSPPNVTSTDSSDTGTLDQTIVNVRLGYTFESGVFLGADYLDLMGSMTSTDASGSIKGSSMVTAVGPTVGYVSGIGLAVFASPFLSFSYSNKSSVTDSSPDITYSTTTDKSKYTGGYNIDVAYLFQASHFAFGPEISYTSLTMKDDVINTDPSGTTTETTGTSTSSVLMPMIGFWSFF